MPDNLFPEEYDNDEEYLDDEENEGTDEENTEEDEDAGYKPSIFFDFDTGDFVTLHDGKLKEASGFEAWVQWCYKTIMTQRYAHEGYSTDIGIDYESALQADSREEAESILQREIEEALMMKSMRKCWEICQKILINRRADFHGILHDQQQ